MTKTNITDIKGALATLHRPDAVNKPGMVYQVWEDGEITLQKGGELFGQRNLHCIVPGVEARAIDREFMPVVQARHGYLFVDNEVEAQAARELILNHNS